MKPLSNVLENTLTTLPELGRKNGLSRILPHGLTAIAGMMTSQQLAEANTPRTKPMGMDRAMELLSLMQRAMSWSELKWKKIQTGDDRYPEKMTREYVFNIPDGYSVDQIKSWVIEAMRPCNPLCLTEISKLIARKRPFNADKEMIDMLLHQTYRQMSGYPESVFYWSVNDAWESESREFPQHHEFKKWATENMKYIQFMDTYFLHNNGE